MNSTNLIRALRSCFAELDDLKDASERAALYAAVGEHLRSAAPVVWVEELERRIAAWVDQEAERRDAEFGYGGDWLRPVAEGIRTGKWRQQ